MAYARICQKRTVLSDNFISSKIMWQNWKTYAYTAVFQNVKWQHDILRKFYFALGLMALINELLELNVLNLAWRWLMTIITYYVR